MISISCSTVRADAIGVLTCGFERSQASAIAETDELCALAISSRAATTAQPLSV